MMGQDMRNRLRDATWPTYDRSNDYELLMLELGSRVVQASRWNRRRRCTCGGVGYGQHLTTCGVFA
jgi:hypothetical protein